MSETIYTSYFSKIKQIKEEFEKPLLINIALNTSEDIKNNVSISMPILAPNKKMLWQYKNGEINELEYEQLYIKQLDKAFGDIKNFSFMSKFKEFDTAFLLCYEGIDKFCHRHILAEYLNKRFNMGIVEYK